MPYSNINDGSKYFQTDVYTGGQTITFDGNSDLQPDWAWFKARTTAENHRVFDSSRGAGKALLTAQTSADETTTVLSSFNSDGVSLGTSDAQINSSSHSYALLGWKMNGGSTTSFSESGDNPGGAYQADTTAGHSIVTYTGTGSAGTVQHGLGSTPAAIIIKDRSEASSWIVFHQNIGNGAYVKLNDTIAATNESSHFNNTDPTSSVFTVGTSTNVNKDGNNYVAYCFCEKKGYSKFGEYKGNGSADGAFIYTGFKPALVFAKQTNTSRSWTWVDDKRGAGSSSCKALVPNETGTEENIDVDFLSNGFKWRQNHTAANQDDGVYRYFCWGTHPFVGGSRGVPANAFFANLP